ncbi:MAG: hypothetical protein ACREF4_10025, partial [Gammaproteobacteria bacterium]
GFMTRFVCFVSTGIYRYRQRRWHRLVRKHLLPTGPRYSRPLTQPVGHTEVAPTGAQIGASELIGHGVVGAQSDGSGAVTERPERQSECTTPTSRSGDLSSVDHRPGAPGSVFCTARWDPNAPFRVGHSGPSAGMLVAPLKVEVDEYIAGQVGQLDEAGATADEA